MKVIVVTGVPGTGKTAIAKKLAKRLNYYYIDVNKLISKHNISEGYDRERTTKIVDIKKLNRFLVSYIVFFKKNKIIDNALMSKARSAKTLTKLNIKKLINNKTSNKKLNQKNKQKIKGLIIDSHLSHYLPKKYVDLCIIAKCDIKELNKRLKKRKYLKNKIQENLQAEIFDTCYDEAIKRKHKVIVINTTKGFNISSVAKQLG